MGIAVYDQDIVEIAERAMITGCEFSVRCCRLVFMYGIYIGLSIYAVLTYAYIVHLH